MIKIGLFIGLLWLSDVTWGQNQEIQMTGDMEVGPVCSKIGEKPHQEKALTFDSSFVFSSDTLTLPFFDDFSTSKFQMFNPDFSNPLTTQQTYYRLLDASSNLPLNNQTSLTNQVTFRRIYDLTLGTTTDVNFNTQSVKESNLFAYPPVYTTLSLYPPYYVFDTLGVPDISDTIWINNPSYFQDSATIFFLPIQDPSKVWLDRQAYHNFRYAVNPRSLGVATFDGLDEDGYPYQFGSGISNYADFLSSKALDLSSNDASDSIYFSFLYQPQGLGDVPESTDSLVLEFYAPVLNQWFHMWSVSGTGVHPFKAVHFPVKDSKFLQDGFSFRFKNYGGLSGSLDHFHIDYVHLRTLSDIGDTLFKDFALCYPSNSLLQTYTSVPWDHYKNTTSNQMATDLNIDVYNGSSNSENYQDGHIYITQNGITLGSFDLPGSTLAGGGINYDARSFYNSIHDLSSGSAPYEFAKNLSGDYQTFDVKIVVSAQFANLSTNDSSRFIQGFYNYYSYDDGSAEAAFGPTGVQSLLAIHYNAYEADSLLGVAMHFVPSVVDVSNKLFLLTVWDDNNGIPGTVLYEDNAFSPRQPTYNNGLNNFNTYYFPNNQKIAVGPSFYVGWRQVEAMRYNLGLDRNIDHSDEIFYSVDFGGNWSNPTFSGSAMMRPVFSTNLDGQLGVEEPEIAQQYHVFPNPCSDLMHIKSPFADEVGYLLLDMQGRTVLSIEGNSANLSEMPNGTYILKSIAHPQGHVKVLKHE